MWQQYKKTLIPTQLAIIAACILLYWKSKMPLPGVLVFFVVMQTGALIGAMWAARLKRRAAPTNPLPLRHR